MHKPHGNNKSIFTVQSFYDVKRIIFHADRAMTISQTSFAFHFKS